MRLLSVTVRDFRGIAAQHLEPLPTGVTVITGPNEVGKTSLTEAVDFLFERHASSQAAEIRQAQPLGRDVGPEVEVEGEAGDYRFRYRKRFVKRPETELEITAPHSESLTGREAHERMTALLEEVGVDLDLWRALRVVQGVGVGQPTDLAASPPLLEALDRAAAGESTGQRRSTALYERARAEYLRHFTDKRGDPRAGGPLQQARDELEEAAGAEEALAADMAALEEAAHRAEELRARRSALRAQEETAAAEREAARAELERVTQLEQEVRSLRSRLGEEESVRDLLDELLEARRAEREVAGRLEAAQAESRRAEADLAPARATLAAAEGDRERAEAELESARRRLQLAERLSTHRGSLEELERRLERAAEAAHRVEDAEATLASLPAVDDAAMAELEELHQETQRIMAALAAASPEVTVTALEDVGFTVSREEEREQVDLAAGGDWRGKPSVPLHVTFPGVAELTVTPGGDVAQLASRRRAVEMDLTSRLEVLGVGDVEAARAAHRDRRRAEGALESARVTLGEAAAGTDLETLTARRETAAAEAARLAEELLQTMDGQGDTEPPTPELAERALGAARTAADAARRREEESRAAAEAKHEARESARGTVRELEVELRNAVERRRRARHRVAEVERSRDDGGPAPGSGQLGLFSSGERPEAETAETGDGVLPGGPGDAPSDPSDAALEAARADAEHRAAALRDELSRARRRLADREPQEVHRQAEAAAERHRECAEELREVEDEHLRVTTRLEHAGESGLFEELREARARLAAAGRRAAGAEARAAAARRLLDALSAARDAARRAYSEPLRRTVEELGRPLFGDDFAVELGEDLTIVRRTASGRTLEVERLSTGAREQLSLLLRLACALLVSPDQGVPLILDDALGYSDPGRLAAMGQILSHAGERCQVMLLTSFPERYRQVRGARRLTLAAADDGAGGTAQQQGHDGTTDADEA